jgi:two-component system chemotaxis sensor kinase CheA
MPLVYLKNALNGGSSKEESEKELMQAVVFTRNGRSVGLVVERIIDIVEETISVKRGANRPGVLGTIVVQDRVTDLLDIENVVQSADPSFLIDTTSVALVEEA